MSHCAARADPGSCRPASCDRLLALVSAVMRHALVDAGVIPVDSPAQKRVELREFRQGEQVPVDLQVVIDTVRADWMRGT